MRKAEIGLVEPRQAFRNDAGPSHDYWMLLRANKYLFHGVNTRNPWMLVWAYWIFEDTKRKYGGDHAN
jgi:hypothetical protein